jgi:hypothetical protein
MTDNAQRRLIYTATIMIALTNDSKPTIMTVDATFWHWLSLGDEDRVYLD